MLKYLLTAAVVSAFALICSTPAQESILADRVSKSPIVSVSPLGFGVLAVHANRSLTYVQPSASGHMDVSFADDPQVGIDASIPGLSTTWTDVLGVSHGVTTPVASSTPAGIRRAIETHKELVKAMQQLYPPRPPI
jgi:hypothetical protein